MTKLPEGFDPARDRLETVSANISAEPDVRKPEASQVRALRLPEGVLVIPDNIVLGED